MDNQRCTVAQMLTKLFPADIINIILPYTDYIVIQLQDYFPQALKHITILGEELFEIHENNHKYITKLDCSNCYRVSDTSIQHLVNYSFSEFVFLFSTVLRR